MALLQLPYNDTSDQISADNEENIYTNESTTEKLESSMKKYDRNNSNGSQAIYFGSMVQI